MPQVHSFDVFDTSLIRRVASPPDVFRLVGMSMLDRIDEAGRENFVENFLAARVKAEEVARSIREETTLDEIWTYLHEFMPEVPSMCGPEDELAAEQKLLTSNSFVGEQIARSRAAGARIVFASDTYLPEKFVREQLLRHGLAEPQDGFYISNAFGAAKWTGELFKVILEREGISPQELHHRGDDFHCDIVMPRRLGIKATLVSDAKPNIWESATRSKGADTRIPASLLIGSMRAFRLGGGSESPNEVRELVATFLGPALTIWAAWVLRAAQSQGIRRLYFVSRDAYLLCKVARLFAADFGEIECRHLRISRHTVLLPATDEISQAGMPWLRRPSSPVTLSFLTWKLGLRWADVEAHFQELTQGKGDAWLLTTDEEWRKFWDIVQRPPIANLVRAEIKSRRSDLVTYLKAEGLCDGVPAALVDLGWWANVQAGLRKILEEDANIPVPKGYYLALRATRQVPKECGSATALFYEDVPYHQFTGPDYEIFKRIDVLDNVLGLAPYGTVHEYRFNGSTLEPTGPEETPAHVEFVTQVENAVEAFCSPLREHASFYAEGAVAREILNDLIGAWCGNPNGTALDALSHITVAYGWTGCLPSQPLLQPWRTSDAVKMLIPARIRGRLKIRKSDPVWPEAAFRRSGLSAQLVLRMSVFLRSMRRRFAH